MAAKVRRDVADPQAAIGRTVVAMRLDELRQRRGVALVPAAVFFVDRRSIVTGAENLGVDQIAVRLGIVRLEFHRPAVAGDRFVQFPLVLEDRPGCCAPRQSPASGPMPGGSRRPLRPASPGPSAHRPGCCALRQRPASVPMPGGSRRPLRPASLGPSRRAQVAVCLGKVRLQFQGPAVAGGRLLQLALVLQDVAQVAGAST